MAILIPFSVIASMCLGVITAYTDIRFHKAKNVHMFIFMMLGIGIQILSALIEPADSIKSLMNIGFTFGTAISFYAAKIWAAGDAKLFATMVMLIPISVYSIRESIIFPAFFVLGIVFSFALSYVLLESIALFIMDLRTHNIPSFRFLIPHMSWKVIISWLFAFAVLDTLDLCILLFWSQLLAANSYLLSLINILFVIALFSYEVPVMWQVGTTAVVVLARLGLSFLGYMRFFSFSISGIMIIIGVAFFRNFTSRYNYRIIPTSKVQQGMVLSQSTVLLFLPSPVKGLPRFTDESARCRITMDEAEAIRRWEGSKQGRDQIVIVRHIPFAPFIMMGVLLLWIHYYL